MRVGDQIDKTSIFCDVTDPSSEIIDFWVLHGGYPEVEPIEWQNTMRLKPVPSVVTDTVKATSSRVDKDRVRTRREALEAGRSMQCPFSAAVRSRKTDALKGFLYETEEPSRNDGHQVSPGGPHASLKTDCRAMIERGAHNLAVHGELLESTQCERIGGACPRRRCNDPLLWEADVSRLPSVVKTN